MKFVIIALALLSVWLLSLGAFAATMNTGGVAGAAENIAGGVVRGAENIAGGAVNAAESIVGGGNNTTHGNNNTTHGGTLPTPTPAHDTRTARHENDTNPATGVGFGLFELAAFGTTMLGAAALYNGKRRR